MSSPAGSPTIAENIRALSRAQKSKAGAPLYSRIINRPAGRVLAAIAHRLGATPDQVTVLSALCTYSGIALIALWRPTVVSAGGSKAGEWLDHVADVIKLSTIHGAIAISLFRFAELPPSVLLIPLAFGAVQNIHFFSYILTYQLRYHGGTPLAKDESRPGILKSVLSAPTDYGLMCFVLMTRGLPVGVRHHAPGLRGLRGAGSAQVVPRPAQRPPVGPRRRPSSGMGRSTRDGLRRTDHRHSR